MRWFNGSVHEAIQEKSNNNALLLVHISNDSADSKAMDKIWEDVDIVEAPVVALRLSVDTPSFQQFSQYYPVMIVPTAYFIGLDGKVIEIAVGLKSKEEAQQFASKAAAIFSGNVLENAGLTTNSQSGTSDMGASSAQTIDAPRQQAQSQHGDTPSEAKTQTPIPPEPPTSKMTDDPLPSTSNEVEEKKSETEKGAESSTIEERLKRTRKIVAQKEVEREKNDELNRRAAAANLQKLKEEMEKKQRQAEAEQRRKDKEADRIYMEKLRKQIEEDRAEKKMRFNAEKQKEQAEREEKERKRAAEIAEKTARDQAARAAIARIQFRLPSGTSVVKQFEPTDQLKKCFDFAKTLAPEIRGNIRLSAVTPRRVFTNDDMELSLVELTLAPSAVLLVLRSESSNEYSGNGFFSIFVASFFTFVASVWAYLTSFLWGRPAVTENSQDSLATNSDQVPTSSSSPSENIHRRKAARNPDEPRQGVGKVYRLHDLRRDDDEDKATWNGNSTNQM